MSKEVDPICLEQICKRDPWATQVVISDGAGFHHRERNTALLDNLHILALPPYSPELNPVERLWDVVKDGICNTVHDTLEDLEEAIGEKLRDYWENVDRVFSLVGSSWLPGSLNAISSGVITRN